MKHILLSILFFLNTIALFAQDNIFMTVIVPERENIPSEAAKQLQVKLQQLVAANGIASDDVNNRFVITAKASILTKDIIPGPPISVSQNIDFTIIIGDAVENKIFETFTISTTGVGQNENKSFISAIKNIKPKSKELIAFLEKGKQDIVSYYNSRCAQVKQEAQSLAAARKYDAAIYQLMLIPDVCDCANDCQELAIQYSKEYTINHAAQLLNEAKAAWAQSPNATGAAKAADIITRIPANTPSQPAIESLTKEINSKLRSDEKKEWEFRMQKYKDEQANHEREQAMRAEQQRADNEYRSRQQAANNAYRTRQQAADNAARKQLIDAYRQVGLAYANNQPKTIIYQKNIILW